jgi:putative transposase
VHAGDASEGTDATRSLRQAWAVPWKEQRDVDQREAFVRAYMQGHIPMSELCRQFGVSRKTGYKWTQRFIDGGLPNLLNRATVPHHVPHAVSADLRGRIIDLRVRFPTWGPKKLQAYLQREHPEESWPARSTMAELLKREGLVSERKPRRRTPQSSFPLAQAKAPNDVWCTDFKGKFRIDRRYCHPLTITDACSRFLFRCEPLEGERIDAAKAVFEKVFREYGMPLRMRSDNGTPFASNAVGGLSRLSIWWIKLGILPERIEVGHPEQNGRHERMHRTLKAEAIKGPDALWQAQREALETWRNEFNQVRPHEALGMSTPASKHTPSPRQFPGEAGDPEYPQDFDVRRLRPDGALRIGSQEVFVAAVLGGECIGLEPVDDGLSHAWFGPVYLGKLRGLGRGKNHFEKHQPVRTTGDVE